MKRLVTFAAALSVSFASAVFAQDVPAEYQQVLTALGKQGDYKANVLKVNIPRNDLSVTVANVKTPTPFGFGGWVAMTKGTDGMDVMMGDLVLTQDEVNPVMSALLDNGIEVTALHNHFLWDEPRMSYIARARSRHTRRSRAQREASARPHWQRHEPAGCRYPGACCGTRHDDRYREVGPDRWYTRRADRCRL